MTNTPTQRRSHAAAGIVYCGVTSTLGMIFAALICAATGRHLGVFLAAVVAFGVVAGVVAERPVAWLEGRAWLESHLVRRGPYCDHCGRPAVGSFYRSLDGPECWHPRCHDAAVKLRRSAGEDL